MRGTVRVEERDAVAGGLEMIGGPGPENAGAYDNDVRH